MKAEGLTCHFPRLVENFDFVRFETAATSKKCRQRVVRWRVTVSIPKTARAHLYVGVVYDVKVFTEAWAMA